MKNLVAGIFSTGVLALASMLPRPTSADPGWAGYDDSFVNIGDKYEAVRETIR